MTTPQPPNPVPVQVPVPASLSSNEKVYSILRWDAFLDLAKWGLSLTALVFASLSIDSYMKLSPTHQCFRHDLANFYVPFISGVIILFALTIVSPYQLSRIFEFVMRYLVPPAVLVLASYLIFLTNDLAQESAKQLID
jgi:membrane-bound acyltransferase YfiQ involved in biofilm formation